VQDQTSGCRSRVEGSGDLVTGAQLFRIPGHRPRSAIVRSDLDGIRVSRKLYNSPVQIDCEWAVVPVTPFSGVEGRRPSTGPLARP